MKEQNIEHASIAEQLRQQIAKELEAMQRGFSAYATGVARHDFIRVLMQQVSDFQEELSTCSGSDHAAHVVCELYMDKVSGKKEP